MNSSRDSNDPSEPDPDADVRIRPDREALPDDVMDRLFREVVANNLEWEVGWSR